MPKKAKCVYIESELIDAARRYRLNVSAISAAALKEAIAIKEGRDLRKEEIDTLRAKIKALESAAPMLDAAPRSAAPPHESAAAPNPAPIIPPEDKIRREIGYYPSLVKRGILSTQTKREAWYKQRAKALGMDLADYMRLVVDEVNANLLGKR